MPLLSVASAQEREPRSVGGPRPAVDVEVALDQRRHLATGHVDREQVRAMAQHDAQAVALVGQETRDLRALGVAAAIVVVRLLAAQVAGPAHLRGHQQGLSVR